MPERATTWEVQQLSDFLKAIAMLRRQSPLFVSPCALSIDRFGVSKGEKR